MTAVASMPPARSGSQVKLVSAPGVPPAIDGLALAAPAEHQFLRAAWFQASGAESTLLAYAGGRAVAAFPFVAAGPSVLGASAIAGLYWPFRNVLLAEDAEDAEVEQALGKIRSTNRLGPLWRLGPVYRDDPTATRLVRLATAAGWSVLTRRLGQTWVFDVNETREKGKAWPRKSTLKRLDGYERELRTKGSLEIEHIVGGSWSPQVMDALAEIERNSWIASGTDHSGAKFMLPARRAFWTRCLADPILAEMISAVLVRLDGRPIAFSLDLTAGDIQYGIAGTYDSEFGPLSVGKLANERNMIWALERGVTRFDWGAGDSGYKRSIGFGPGSDIVDLLFLRNPAAAALLRRRWQRPHAARPDDAKRLPLTRRQTMLVASFATAAAVAAMAE